MRSTLFATFLLMTLAGCAQTSPAKNDPYESFNRKVFSANERMDKYALKPLAEAYSAILPTPAKKLANNFFSNLDDVSVTLNDFLQLKFAQGISDGSRVLFNTTFGIFGLLNVTDRLPKHNEDFGQTLGYWGIQPGPYLMLPFFGPSNLRDSAGLAFDSYTGVITNIPDIPTRNSLYVTNKIRARERLLNDEDVLNEVDDRYQFIRDLYLQNRENLVFDGNPPQPEEPENE